MYKRQVFDAPKDISFETPAPTKIVVHGIDKQAVGAIAADIREVRKPEPYLGKGIRYENEHIRRDVYKRQSPFPARCGVWP